MLISHYALCQPTIMCSYASIMLCCGRKHGVAEQVDILLRQASGIDNLSNMYEGWTPWV